MLLLIAQLLLHQQCPTALCWVGAVLHGLAVLRESLSVALCTGLSFSFGDTGHAEGIHCTALLRTLGLFDSHVLVEHCGQQRQGTDGHCTAEVSMLHLL